MITKYLKPKSVDAAISSLLTAVDDLEAVRDAKNLEASVLKEQMTELGRQKAAAETESFRADAVARKIRNLLEA